MGTAIRAQQRSSQEQPRPRPRLQPAREAWGRAPAPLTPFDFAHTAIHGEHERTPDHAKIAASGDPTITITYTPEASDKSTKIVFIQTMLCFIDGVAVKNSKMGPGKDFQDADHTPALWHVDYFQGEKDPYYNGDDTGMDSGAQGDATAKPAKAADMTDGPTANDSNYAAGQTKKRKDFRTASFSAAGADRGTFYDWVDWTFEREKGKTSSIKVGSTGTGSPGTNFSDAVNLWCKNHSFVLPAPAAAATPTPKAPTPTPAPTPKK